ncbi:MAG: hypothetical protein EOO11_03465 [Chitinophagaceae bacterium]|nr:MAG: hypothetical protein EOO11_03465 [Chitinophagaceae bacterium]
MDPEKTGLVPPQEEGGQSNTEASRSFDTDEAANEFFELLKERLCKVNDWHRIAGPATAVFQLTDANGVEVDRPLRKGDHFKIDIPGPGPATGAGFDWVEVESVEEGAADGAEHLTVQVRPATNPNNERSDVAHFFSEDATSCFMVRREGNTVTAAVYGRNEKPNTGAERVVDKARNVAVATGAIAAASKLQWKSLVEGLVKDA